MAGAGDRAFREICARMGADAFCTEMISAKACVYGDKKTWALARVGEVAVPCDLQLFGSEPEIMAEAALRLCEKERFAGVDLNFGCPVPKIVGNGEGSALMRRPDRIFEIVSAVVKKSPLPVSVKIRAGWSDGELNAPEVARAAEAAGASRITVHGRTRADLYRDGTVKPAVIASVKGAVAVPVIANGDVKDGASARALLEATGADGLMIGRAAVGSPWVFREIRAALEGTEPEPFSKREVLREHIRLAFAYKPETAGREMRMHVSHYLKGFRGAAQLRDRATRLNTCEEYLSLVQDMNE